MNNTTLANECVKNKKLYEQYAIEFQRIFGERLWNYWDLIYGFDLIKFADNFFPCNDTTDGISLNQMIEIAFGERARDLIKILL